MVQSQPLFALGTGADIPIPSIEAPESLGGLIEVPSIPVIEAPETHNTLASAQLFKPPDTRFLSPFHRSLTTPRTPSAQRSTFDWETTGAQGQANCHSSRATSTISSLSESSDDSDTESDRFSYGGSCTSPESDAADPFGFPSPKKLHTFIIMGSSLESSQESSTDDQLNPKGKRVVAKKVHWTPEMDNHIWTIYLNYCQDPKVTPFKIQLGNAPPLGVCHRIASEAKKTWPGGKAMQATMAAQKKGKRPLKRDSTPKIAIVTARMDEKPFKRESTPDTITTNRSGSATPTLANTQAAFLTWPKSSASTRRRLRELCKRKNPMLAHYQRLLKTRSPSPYESSSGPSSAHGNSHLPPISFNDPPAFNTRDVKIALATSTASTMQPDGPLAQLGRSDFNDMSLPAQPSSDNPEYGPQAPGASSPSMPSSDTGFTSTIEPSTKPPPSLSTVSPLASPFQEQPRTWGPSRSYGTRRRPGVPVFGFNSAEDPFDPQATASTASTISRLRSPIDLPNPFGTFPNNNKRRADHLPAEELAAGGGSREQHARQLDIYNVINRRRVRSRGFSLGDALVADLGGDDEDDSSGNGNSLGNGSGFSQSTVATAASLSSLYKASDENDQARMQEAQRQNSLRLGSPFPGIRSRPNRGRAHLPTASLPIVPSAELASIDAMLLSVKKDDHDQEMNNTY